MFIADTGNNKIRVVDPGTNLSTTIVGTGASGQIGDGGAALDAKLNSPYHVIGDAAGSLFISKETTTRSASLTIPPKL